MKLKIPSGYVVTYVAENLSVYVDWKLYFFITCLLGFQTTNPACMYKRFT